MIYISLVRMTLEYISGFSNTLTNTNFNKLQRVYRMLVLYVITDPLEEILRRVITMFSII
jgi:hypothetical protein